MPNMHLALVLLAAVITADEPGVAIAPAVRDTEGVLVHAVESPYQPGKTQIRVLLPDQFAPEHAVPVVYVLPVESQNERRYGDGLVEIKRQNLHNKYRAVFVAPSFAQLPWYADHPGDPLVRQESYFCRIVVPAVEERYAVQKEAAGRLLLGFSKSGFGAWTLLLRHPETFGRAAAWDAPLTMRAAGPYGSLPIFGTQPNFEFYRPTSLIRARTRDLSVAAPRLMLAGYSGFRQAHQDLHAQLNAWQIPHVYRDGHHREHNWHSGWVAELVEWLLTPAK